MTIGVISLLLALTLPALFRMRRNAEFVRSLATHREIASSLQLYAADHRGAFPYFMTEGDPLGPKRLDGFDLPVPYFRAGHVFWPNLVVPDYFSSDLPFFMAIPPDREAAVERNLFDGYPPQTIRSRYFMTDTAFAAPEYWATDDTPSDLGLLRGTLLSDVRFPANKGLTVDMLTGAFSDRDRDGFVDPDAVPLAAVGLGDGSARTVPWSDATHDLSRVVERPFGALPWPIFSTRGGLAGTDF
ncbi:MAG TPA: hypothetical protein VNN12_08940 [Dehalococcoidia bacterium]|nr:hypothetical protein [Dehalococcoidia bacterium]